VTGRIGVHGSNFRDYNTNKGWKTGRNKHFAYFPSLNTMSSNSLDRFITAQETAYDTALAEIKNGRKRSHWIWYIFPQLKGLGFSHHSEYYGLSGIDEAKAYLEHPVLGKRLIEISKDLLDLPSSDPAQVMGYPDDLKLNSCMTLFANVPGADPVFNAVIDKFFNGKPDHNTLALLSQKP